MLKPEIDPVLVKKMVDFFIDKLNRVGVLCLGQETRLEHDPDEDYWYVVVDLNTNLTDPVIMANINWEIMDNLARDENQEDWSLSHYLVRLRFAK